MFVIEEKPWIQFLKFLILKRLCHCNITCFLNYTWIKKTGIWLVNSHTPLTVTMESDWATVKHISAVLRPDWSTERSLQFLYMRKVRNQINECNIGWKKTVKSLRRHIVIFNFSFVKTLFFIHFNDSVASLNPNRASTWKTGLNTRTVSPWEVNDAKTKKKDVSQGEERHSKCLLFTSVSFKMWDNVTFNDSQKKHTDELKTVPVQYNAILTEKQKKQKCSIKFNNK